MSLEFVEPDYSNIWEDDIIFEHEGVTYAEITQDMLDKYVKFNDQDKQFDSLIVDG